jgi:hypothetical protein
MLQPPLSKGRRPALADDRVQCNAAGQVLLRLKTPWRDGATQLVLTPLQAGSVRLHTVRAFAAAVLRGLFVRVRW